MGTLRNLREIFFSRIPPSLNDFRSFVKEDDHIMMGTFNQNRGERPTDSKEKIDIEMGNSKHIGDNSLPEILRNLDFDDDDLDDNLKTNEEGEADSDPFHYFKQELKDSKRSSIVDDNHADGVRSSIQISIVRDEIHRVEKPDADPHSPRTSATFQG